jgi:hypothetical protein
LAVSAGSRADSRRLASRTRLALAFKLFLLGGITPSEDSVAVQKSRNLEKTRSKSNQAKLKVLKRVNGLVPARNLSAY